MNSRVILVLVVLAVIFSIVGVVSDLGIMQVIGGTAQEVNELPFTFGFIVIILLILIVFLVLVDVIRMQD